jgi:transposase-like protein
MLDAGLVKQSSCPKCKGKNLVKRGMDKGQQRYECKFCLHKFRHQG